MTQMPIIASMDYLYDVIDHALLLFGKLFKTALVSVNKFINRILEIDSYTSANL